MVIKVYVAGINSSAEIRSYQQRSQFILDSLRVDYESVDITGPDVDSEAIKTMIKEKCKHRNEQPPKTPQFFNDDIYCGDWFDFEIASDEDRVLEWLGLEDTREEVPDELPAGVKEIEGNEDKENEAGETIKTEINAGIITTETTTKEESIIFSNQNARTAPISVRLDESGKEVIEWKDENGQIEEENVLLEKKMEIIKGDEEVVTRVVENQREDERPEEHLENGDLNEENGIDGSDAAENEDENEQAGSAEEQDGEANESADDQSMEEE